MQGDFSFLEQEFYFPGPITGISPLGSGHIHDTYLIRCGSTSKFVLQKFNHFVFKKPEEVARNIGLVLEHIRNSSDTDLQSLQIHKTKKGALLYQSAKGEFWRIFNYVEDSESYDQVEDPNLAYGGARAFGSFVELMNGLNPDRLFTTIPNFHHLGIRFEQLKDAVNKDSVDRVKSNAIQVEFALQRETTVSKCSSMATEPKIPLRVTHNDTKINNVLFQKGTTTPLCVIDLDTVMPGLLLYDFGDMARTFCNRAQEEEPPERAGFMIDIFEAMCRGFFDSLKTPVDGLELDSLKLGPWWMTYIMGIRFLTDFLSGDVYYKTSYSGQNLDRASNQFQLLVEIEDKQSEIDKIIDSCA